jgi:NAD(P)-dependent dehydrogenase (short-subunit alcohol dehydrogenase family)
LTRPLLPSLRAAHGRIVNIGAISAQTTPPFFGAAGATKSALASFNDALRIECAILASGLS